MAAIVAVAALPAWRALHDALAGVEPPCSGAPGLWTGPDMDAAAAVEGCERCSALAECAAYAEAAGEREGVWGGVWREGIAAGPSPGAGVAQTEEAS